MATFKNLHGECQHCGGPLEFPADAAGTVSPCPHCGQQTELFLSTDEVPSSKAPTRAIVFSVLVLLILGSGLVGVLMALNRAKRMASGSESALANQTATANFFSGQRFGVSTITLERAEGSPVINAAGVVTNLAPHRRLGVRVEIELQDEAGNATGTATDHIAVMEPGATWNFKATVPAGTAKAGHVISIKEGN